jgi:hypothetical protein
MFLVADCGEVFVWGRLCGEELNNIVDTPTRLDSLYNKELFIHHAAIGNTHSAFISDTNSTDLLRAMIKYVDKDAMRCGVEY